MNTKSSHSTLTNNSWFQIVIPTARQECRSCNDSSGGNKRHSPSSAVLAPLLSHPCKIKHAVVLIPTLIKISSQARSPLYFRQSSYVMAVFHSISSTNTDPCVFVSEPHFLFDKIVSTHLPVLSVAGNSCLRLETLGRQT